jgi:hypothetical protein
MVHELLTDGQSPLYGEDVDRLRHTLTEIVVRLDSAPRGLSGARAERPPQRGG